MNVIKAIQDYISKMISSVQGMKVLLLDKETTGIVSMVFSQSQILQKEVYLFERLDIKNRELMAHLKAICFLRPTIDNLRLLEEELKEPKYGEYHIFFSNTIKNSYVEELAEADEYELVQQLQEFFADYYPVTSSLFTINLETVISIQQPNWRNILDRSVDGLASILLSLKKQPFIRYSSKSEICKKTIDELQHRIQQEPGLFDFRKQDTPPLLLILDRRDDPVTPLLTQWTYQAMVHELFGIKNNRVDLKNIPGIKKDLQEIVLSSEQDPWFKETMYLNFGDLGIKVKELVDEYQQKTKNHQNIDSIEDIKKFVENYPEFKKLSGNVTKHVTLLGELSKLVDQRSLMDLSEIEQELANNHDHSLHVKMVKDALKDNRFTKEDKIRLVLLYTIRYETYNNEIPAMIELLQQIGCSSEQYSLVSSIIKYAGANVRTGELFIKNSLKRTLKILQRGLKGVSNIYTEHKPYLKQILESLLIQKLPLDMYPFYIGSPTKESPQEIIVFFVGGTTYEEALTVHELKQTNKNISGVRIILGGTTIHNSKSFLHDITQINSFK